MYNTNDNLRACQKLKMHGTIMHRAKKLSDAVSVPVSLLHALGRSPSPTSLHATCN